MVVQVVAGAALRGVAGGAAKGARGAAVPTPTLPPITFNVLAVALALTVSALLAPARNPLAIEREPEKDDDPVPEKVLVPPVVSDPLRVVEP